MDRVIKFLTSFRGGGGGAAANFPTEYFKDFSAKYSASCDPVYRVASAQYLYVTCLIPVHLVFHCDFFQNYGWI